MGSGIWLGVLGFHERRAEDGGGDKAEFTETRGVLDAGINEGDHEIVERPQRGEPGVQEGVVEDGDGGCGLGG